jgi:hypothetical protein
MSHDTKKTHGSKFYRCGIKNIPGLRTDSKQKQSTGIDSKSAMM